MEKEVKVEDAPGSDPRERTYSFYLVALADVLGQSNVFEEYLKGLPPFGSETLALYQSRLEEAHDNTVEVIEQIDDHLRDFYDLIRSRVSGIPLPESLSGMKNFNLVYRTFSDSFFAYAPFFHIPNMKYLYPSIAAAFCAIVTYGYLMLQSLARGKPVRGGIEIGFATELHSGEVYGPVRYQVYKLERERAQYPRVVVGDELRGFLAAAKGKRVEIPNAKREDLEACSRTASQCLDMITEDVDGVYMIDHMGEALQIALSRAMVGDLNNQAYTFVKNECSKWGKAGNHKLAMRYHLLAEYFRKSGRIAPL